MKTVGLLGLAHCVIDILLPPLHPASQNTYLLDTCDELVLGSSDRVDKKYEKILMI